MSKQVIDEEKTLSEHLIELRNRVIVALLALVAAFIGMYFVADKIIKYLLDLGDRFGYKMIYVSPQEILIEQLYIAGVFALFLAMPVIAYEICAYIYPVFEKRSASVVMFILCVMGAVFFIGGVLFSHKYLLPFTYQMLYGLGLASGADAMITVANFVSLYIKFCVCIGIIFEFPMVTAALSHIGVLTPGMMFKHFRLVIVICLIIAAFLTPPDVITQLILAVPMIGIYLIAIIVSAIFQKKRVGVPKETEEENVNANMQASA